MRLNDYSTLGCSGLRVSPLCLGTMTFGEEWGFGSTPAVAYQVMDAYLGAGGNFIDTANIYTKGHSEAIIGDYFADRPGRRDRCVIATKFCGSMFPGDPNGGGAQRKNMRQAVEDSLRRLKTDYIDLYWVHFRDPYTPIEETMRAFDDLVRAGKVLHVGVSDWPAWSCARAQTIAELRGWTPLIGLQVEYNLIERTIEGELVPMARELGLGITPWSPLKGGMLTGKHRRDGSSGDFSRPAMSRATDREWDIVDELCAVADEIGQPPAAVALAWLRGQPGVTSTIIGARTLEQLEKNLASLDVVLSDDHRARLNAVSEPTLPFPIPFLQRSAWTVMHNGTSINGEHRDEWPMTARDGDRF